MNVQGENCWIIASIGCVTANLLQGNDLAGVNDIMRSRGVECVKFQKKIQQMIH